VQIRSVLLILQYIFQDIAQIIPHQIIRGIKFVEWKKEMNVVNNVRTR